MWYVIIFFLIIYFCRIINNAIKYFESKTLIRTYDDFMGDLIEIRSQRKIENSDFIPMIELNPKFNNLSDNIYWGSEINYHKNADVLSRGLISNFNNLRRLNDELKFEFRKLTNPFNTMKFILLFPGRFLNTIGFNLNQKSQSIVSLITFLLTYFLGMFQQEIKEFIINIFK